MDFSNQVMDVQIHMAVYVKLDVIPDMTLSGPLISNAPLVRVLGVTREYGKDNLHVKVSAIFKSRGYLP